MKQITAAQASKDIIEWSAKMWSCDQLKYPPPSLQDSSQIHENNAINSQKESTATLEVDHLIWPVKTFLHETSIGNCATGRANYEIQALHAA